MKVDADYSPDEHRKMAEAGITKLDRTIAGLKSGTTKSKATTPEGTIGSLQGLVGVLTHAVILLSGRGAPEPYPGANDHIATAALKAVEIAHIAGTLERS